MAQNTEQTIARQVTLEGVVTGVGFRFFVREVVMETGDLSGYVRNLSSGRVECVLQGSPENVDAAIQRIQQGPPAARVDKCDVKGIAVNPKYDRFSIVP